MSFVKSSHGRTTTPKPRATEVNDAPCPAGGLHRLRDGGER